MLIDVHCHANLYLVIEEIVKEAERVKVNKIISVAMSVTSLERVMEIANSFESIYPALGIHPEEVENNPNIELWIVEGAGHVQAHKLFVNEYEKRIKDFLKKHMK